MTHPTQKALSPSDVGWKIASSSNPAIYGRVLAYNLFGDNALARAHTRQAGSFTFLHEAILRGLPARSLTRLSEGMSLTRVQVSEVVQIPKRTVARRKVFKADESDRIYRLATLFQKAVELFGNLDSARRWFVKPQRALGGKTPLRCAETTVGAQEVEGLIGRLEHGVFS